MEAAMIVAHKAISNGIQENSQNVIQPIANVDNLGPNTTMSTPLKAVSSSPRPNSAPTISTDPVHQEQAILAWNHIDASLSRSNTNSMTTQPSSMICTVGKKRPCDPMSDVINSQAVLPTNSAAYLSTSVTLSPSGLHQYVSPGNFSHHPHAKNAALLQASLLSSQQPILVHWSGL